MNENKDTHWIKMVKSKTNFAIIIQKPNEIIVDGVFGEQIFRTLTEAQEYLQAQGFKRESNMFA